MNTNLLNKLDAWRGDAVALVAGLLLPLAFAPFSLAPLAIVSLAALFLLWFISSPGRAFWRGWLFGVGYFGFGVSWVSVSMYRFGGMSMPLSVFITAGFVMFLALFPALIGYVARRLFRRTAQIAWFQLALLLPALWVLVEWVRSWIFTGFPWLSVGYSQIDWPLAGYAPLWGVYSISYGVALTAGLLLYAWLERGRVRQIAGAGVGAIWLVGLALSFVNWTDPVDGPISVAMIQGNIAQDQKWKPEQQRAILEMYADTSRANWGAQLIIWPETAAPALYHTIKPFLNAVAQEARVNGAELLIGIPVEDRRTKQYYNTMMTLGAQEDFYEKRHLVPFGEYIPMAGVLGGVLDFFKIPMSNFSEGTDEAPLLEVAGQKVGISICFEDVFGEEVIAALPDATLLVNASNDAWFGDSIAPHQHLQIARMRAVETGRYMLRSTNTGVSAVIDAKGKVLTTSPSFQQHVLKAQVQPMQGMTLYAIFGNLLVVVFVSGLTLFAAWYHWKRAKGI